MTRLILNWTTRSLGGPLRFVVPLFWLFAFNAQAQTLAPEPLDCLIEPNLLVDVSSSEVGILGSVGVDEADVVRKGEVIAALRTDVERAVLKLSRSRADAVAQLALLRRDYEFNTRQRSRLDKLRNQQVVSAQSVDEARTTEDVSRLRLRAATEKQHTVQLEAARDALSLDRRTVRSPIDGVVVQRYKSAGEFVEGDPIVQIAQLDPLRVEVVAPISMFGSITVGMQATVLAELPMDDNFVASVISIDPIMDAATATFGVRLSLPNPQHRLPPGLKCTLVMIDHQESPEGADMAPDPLESAAIAEPEATPAAEQTVVAHESGIDAAPMTLSPIAASSVQAADASSVPATGTQIETTATSVTTSEVVAPSAQAADAPPATPAGTQAETAPEPASASTAVEPAVQVADASPVPRANTTPVKLNLRADSCATLGPLPSGPESDEVTARFSASGLGFERRYVGGAKIRVPWLVLSRDTYPAPAKIIERLKQAGVSDFQLLTKGEWRNRVSYGGYVGRKYAQHRLQTMQARGFAAELRRRTRANTKIWLDLAHVFSVPALSSVITGVLNDHPTLTVKSIPCTQLASR